MNIRCGRRYDHRPALWSIKEDKCERPFFDKDVLNVTKSRPIGFYGFTKAVASFFDNRPVRFSLSTVKNIWKNSNENCVCVLYALRMERNF